MGNWKGWIWIVLAILLVLAGLCIFGGWFIARLAMDRHPPKVLDQMMGALSGEGKSEGAGKTERWKKACETLKNRPHQTVTIQSSDGTNLTGHYFEVSGSKRLLILFHGWRGGWYSDFARLDPALRDAGCSLLYAEMRATQTSGGNAIGFGLLEKDDVKAWAHWAEKNQDLPVYVMGQSMGAASVLMAADEDLPVKGIISDCGYNDCKSMFRHILKDNLHMPVWPLWLPVQFFFKQKTGKSINSASAEKSLSKCVVPVLIIHGMADTFVPPEMAQTLYDAAAAGSQLFLVPEAGHCMSYAKDPEGYMDHLNTFFQTCEKDS